MRGEIETRTGMIINLADLKQIVKQQIIDAVDHKHLNHDIWWLKDITPTVENLTVVFWERLREALGPHLYEVKLYETANNWAIYRAE